MATTVDSLEIQIKSDATNALNALDKLERKLDSVITKMASAFGSGSNLSNVQAFTQAFDTMGQSAKSCADNVKDAMSQIKSASMNGIAKQAKTVSNAMNQVATSAGKASKSVQNVVAPQTPPTSAVTPNVANASALNGTLTPEQVDKLNAKIRETATLLSSLKITVKTNELKKVEKDLQRVTDNYNKLADKFNEKSSKDLSYATSNQGLKDKENLASLRQQRAELEQMQESLSRNGGFRLNTEGISKGLKVFEKGLQNVRNTLISLNQKINTVFGRMASSIKSATKSLPKLSDSFKRLRGLSDKLTQSFSRMGKMLRLMLVRTALRSAIKAVGDGFNSLTQYSDKFNANVSMLWNSMRQLGNSVSAVAVPLINALAPAINTIIQLCISAVNAINQLISAITGASTWTKAKGLSDNYAKSLDKASGSVKKLNKQLQSFDELNNITTSDSGGSSAVDPSSMFKEEPISKIWKEWADWIKRQAKDLFEPIKKAWDAVGQYVISSARFAFVELAKLISDIYKDFMKVWKSDTMVAVFENLLLILGDVLATIGWIAKGLDEAWRYANNGYRIFMAIAQMLLAITHHIRNMTKATRDWAKKFDFKPLMSKLAEFVESMVQVVDAVWGVIEDFYNTVILGLLSYTLRDHGFLWQLMDILEWFNNEVDWEGIRSRLQQFWEKLEPFTETVGDGFLLFIDKIVQKVADFLNGGSLDKMLDKIEKWMDGINAVDVAQFLETIAKIVIGIKIAIPVIEGMGKVIQLACMLMQSGMLSAIGAALPFIGILVGVAVALVGAFAYSEEFRSSIGKLFDVLSENVPKLGDDFNDLKGQVENLFKSLGDLLAPFVDLASYAIPYLVNSLEHLLTRFSALIEMVSGLAEILSATVNGVVGVGKQIWGGITANQDLQKEGKEQANKFADAYKKGLADELGGKAKLITSLVPVLNNSNTPQELDNYAHSILGVKNATDDYADATKRLASESRNTSEAVKQMQGSNERMAERYQKQAQENAKVARESESALMDYYSALDGKGLLSNVGEANSAMFDKFATTSSKDLESLFNSKVSQAWSNIFNGDNLVDPSLLETAGLNMAKQTTDAYAQGMLDNVNVVEEKLPTEVKTSLTNTVKEATNQEDIKKASSGIEDGIVSTFKDFKVTFGTEMETWYKELKSNYFSSAKWMELGKTAMSGLISGIKSQKSSFHNAFTEMINNVTNQLSAFSSSIGSAGTKSVSTNSIKLATATTRANGGFDLPRGDLFIANEKEPELVGTIKGRPSVANQNQIESGIAQGVYQANADQNGYFASMIELLGVIANKDLSIGDDAIYNSYQRGASSHSKRMGFV